MADKKKDRPGKKRGRPDSKRDRAVFVIAEAQFRSRTGGDCIEDTSPNLTAQETLHADKTVDALVAAGLVVLE